jgi:hypothetical protein
MFAAAPLLPNRKSGAERPELKPTLERGQIIPGDRPTVAVAKAFQLARRAIVAVVL